jgi:nitrile hydratase
LHPLPRIAATKSSTLDKTIAVGFLDVDGVHDLGGLDGFGPVEYKSTEPFFEEDWERRTLRLMIGLIATPGVPGGRLRHSIERMAPEHYLSSP